MYHVLLVDDDPVQAAAYERLLASRELGCHLTSDMREALESFARRRPDAILLDLGVPGHGAVEFIRTVRDLPQGRGVRVIVLANAFLEAEALEAWEAGADQVVGKSNCSPEQVVEFLLAEVGPRAPEPTTESVAQLMALADFLQRSKGYVDRTRTAIERLRKGEAPGPALDEITTSMRRLQTAQALGLLSVAQAAGVGEWLARALGAWPSSVGPSSLRTLGQVASVLETRLTSPQNQVKDPAKSRALAVDDDAASRTLVVQACRRVRLECDVFDNAPAALAAAAARPYDLVVSDVMMPGMDGFAMVAKLRELPGFADTPVVYVTALDGFEAAFTRDSRGGSDVIVKPYLIMELAAKAVVHLMTPQVPRLPPLP